MVQSASRAIQQWLQTSSVPDCQNHESLAWSQVVKLSDTVQKLPRQVTSNVHGVAQCFLDVGRQTAAAAAGNASGCIQTFAWHVHALGALSV